MGNLYSALKQKHQSEFNDFPIFFAFSNEQFREGMAKFGLSEDDTDQIYSLSGTGGFYLREDAPRLREMWDRHEKEMQEAIDADETGDGFVFDMFNYELGNHEYGYTWDAEPALDALGLTFEKVNADPKLKYGFEKAKRAQREAD